MTLVLACVNLAACGGALTSKAGSSSAARTAVGAQQVGARRGSRGGRPARNRRLMLFAACVRQRGVNVVVLDRGGDRPRLDLSGADTSSAQFESAWARCREDVNLGGAAHVHELGGGRLGIIRRH